MSRINLLAVPLRPSSVLMPVVIAAVATACDTRLHEATEANEIARWTLVEDLRLGSAIGATPEAFGANIAIEASADGTLYVADQQSYHIQIFDSAGMHQRSLGGRGSGPGEVLDLIGVKLDARGNLWAVDAGNGRYSIFLPDGTLHTTLPFKGFHTTPWKGTVDSAGSVHNLILLFRQDGPRLAYVRTALSAADTLLLPPYTAVQQKITSPAGQERLVNVPFAPRPHWAIDRAGKLWFGFSDDYRIYRIDYGGDTIAAIERPDGSVELTDTERRAAIESMLGPFPENPHIEDAWVPHRRPQYESIEVDDRNRVWVGVPARGGLTRYEVFTPAGQIIARAEFLEPTASPESMLVRGDHLYTVTTDSLGVPSIVRYRIELTGSGITLGT